MFEKLYRGHVTTRRHSLNIHN